GPRLPRVPAGHRRPSPLPRRRRQAAWTLALAGGPLQCAAMVPFRHHLQLSSVLLLFLLEVVAAAALGGAGPALAAATVGFLLATRLLGAFEQQGVAVLRRNGGRSGSDPDRWNVEAGAGDPVPASPVEATETLPLGEDTVLALVGPRLPAGDRHLLSAFTAQL